MKCQMGISKLTHTDINDNNNDNDSENLKNYYNYSNNYNNYLSCQLPPIGNSPPSNDFINLYLNHILHNKKLDLTVDTYKAYK